jgi:prephenate dehydrogenase
VAPTRADRETPAFGPRIAFLGFGLIGGSIAMALRAQARDRGPVQDGEQLHLAAWTPKGHGPAEGLDSGLLDAAPATPEAAIDGADLVILAAPPLAILEHLDRLAGPWRTALGGALVTDVGSTKRAIVDRAAAHRLRFVGGHPMAGRETTGVGSASAALFVGRPWVVVGSSVPAIEDLDRVDALATATGARPIRLGAAEHDAAVAAISHLPLLASAALVEAVAGDPAWRAGAARELAASGWRDTTRLAAGSPEMGAGILATNATELLPRLRALRTAIDGWIEELQRQPDEAGPGLQRRLEAARAELLGDPRHEERPAAKSEAR